MNNEITDIIKLGPRLHMIASYVPEGAFLGDIGTDHAYLPVYLSQKGIISHAIGVDIHKGPFESAKENVRDYGLKERIEIRFGNGLAPLKPGEVDTLTIAGMGGGTILEILRSNPDVIDKVKSLVLQPQGAEARVRKELLAEGWKLIHESLVEEDGRVYTVISLSKTEGYSIEEINSKVRQLAEEFLELIFAENMTCKKEDPVSINRKEHDNTKEPDNTEEWDDTEELITKLIWQLGPLVLLRKLKLLEEIFQETVRNLQKVIVEMSKTDREDVKMQAAGLRREIYIMGVISRWLSQ